MQSIQLLRGWVRLPSIYSFLDILISPYEAHFLTDTAIQITRLFFPTKSTGRIETIVETETEKNVSNEAPLPLKKGASFLDFSYPAVAQLLSSFASAKSIQYHSRYFLP